MLKLLIWIVIGLKLGLCCLDVMMVCCELEKMRKVRVRVTKRFGF